MAKFKIKVIGHLCRNNYIAKWDEVVDESQLTSSADELVKAGFIEPVEEVNEVVDESQLKEDIKNIKVKEPKEVKAKK